MSSPRTPQSNSAKRIANAKKLQHSPHRKNNDSDNTNRNLHHQRPHGRFLEAAKCENEKDNPSPHDRFLEAKNEIDKAAFRSNINVICCGIATDPLSYFNIGAAAAGGGGTNNNGEGSKLIAEFYRDAYSTRQNFLNRFRGTIRYDERSGLRELFALDFALQSATTFIEQKKTIVRARLYQVSGYSDVWAVPEKEKDLVQEQYTAIAHAEWVVSFISAVIKEAYHMLDSMENEKTLITVRAEDLGRSSVEYILNEKIGNNCMKTISPYQIASYLALKSMDDIKKIKSKTIILAILKALHDLGFVKGNPYFTASIKRLKKLGILHSSFSIPNGYGNKSLSSVRWILMLYLEIPGFADKEGCSTFFELKTKETEHPDEWSTSTIPESSTVMSAATATATATTSAANVSFDTEQENEDGIIAI